MENPTLYKKKAINDVRNRTTSQLNSDELVMVTSIVEQFVSLFKTKHL